VTPARFGREPVYGDPCVVALGGGHGLSASLTALRRLTRRLTGIVTVADNGGSSGRIRKELGVLPPGDLRMALAALCRDDEWGQTWARVLQHRLDGNGELHGHAVGNLLIVALWEQVGDPVEALAWVGRLLGAQGRVLPMSTVPLEIEASVRFPGDPAGRTRTVRGQHQVAVCDGEVRAVRLLPSDPPAAPEALAAVRAADAVVLGPGSWFTSVIPHLLVPDLAEALVAAQGRRLLVLNLAAPPGETDGLSPAEHLRVLAEHAPALRFDAVLADPGAVDARGALAHAAHALGAELVVAPVAADDDPARHDPQRLAAAIAPLLHVSSSSAPSEHAALNGGATVTDAVTDTATSPVAEPASRSRAGRRPGW
jgi:uncharacterized cofD-like protein